MKNIALTAIVFSCLLLAACHKSSSSDITTVTIDTALKADFNFQQGSYWIYRDSISGNVDSFFVEYTSHTFDNINNNFIIENLGIVILGHSINMAIDKDTIILSFFYESTMFNLDYFVNHLGAEISLCPLVNYPYQSSFNQFSGFAGQSSYGDIGKIINIFDSYSLNGQTFSNVAAIEHSSSDSQPSYTGQYIQYSYDDQFYVCPNVGLIKIILNHPVDSFYRVWELQKYSIIN